MVENIILKSIVVGFLSLMCFVVGFVFGNFCDVVFSIANSFVQKALYYRKKRKEIDIDANNS